MFWFIWCPVLCTTARLPKWQGGLRAVFRFSFTVPLVAGLALSVLLPVVLVRFLNYDVRNDYLHKSEMLWMFAGNAFYYLIAVSLAFIYKDHRAFCKLVCPVPVIMKLPAAVALNMLHLPENRRRPALNAVRATVYPQWMLT